MKKVIASLIIISTFFSCKEGIRQNLQELETSQASIVKYGFPDQGVEDEAFSKKEKIMGIYIEEMQTQGLSSGMVILGENDSMIFLAKINPENADKFTGAAEIFHLQEEKEIPENTFFMIYATMEDVLQIAMNDLFSEFFCVEKSGS